ncbi:nickel pincer cofactor biosynthesis protein LarC [uncultured Sunxiuqinia sp.]|mgnify:CR=1 FL=1|jgi:pyridinium-3,5-bisthiocarboxylic acid mononucleotide nickel chelatase|uniref:nickel pincer cofactor biosynthesis protein LarC n=1 Tax=uncultured Sunxiuqinia sp. TaxID=1573825 RepID=UPI0030DBF30B|tara:strand:+ start:40176 stop:41351 length:1176 start_codon:yes stop_codon:yes gene_type:complete
MKILYYDCFAGISGDMNLGALIDLGVDANYLTTELEKLNIEGFHLEIRTDQRRGITGTKAEVVIENQENEKHRHLRHVEEIVNNSSLPEQVKINALKIFDLIAVAEAKVHNISKQAVHFHEVGALDSIADIVGAAICLDYLNVDKVMSSPIQLGGGTVSCAHGIMPVPAPATAEIVKNIPVKTGLVNHEATTPTGAAILVATVDEFTDQINLPITKTAYGIGNRDSEVPNVLRVHLLEDAKVVQDVGTEEATLLESNIDDMNPEHYDFILEQLFRAGASDAWLLPIIMKKSRPAIQLSVLCKAELADKLKAIIFVHSTSIGIREYRVRKNVLRREETNLETTYGPVRIKQSFYGGKLVHSKPEFDDCKKLAEANQLSLSEIEEAIRKQLEK